MNCFYLEDHRMLTSAVACNTLLCTQKLATHHNLPNSCKLSLVGSGSSICSTGWFLCLFKSMSGQLQIPLSCKYHELHRVSGQVRVWIIKVWQPWSIISKRPIFNSYLEVKNNCNCKRVHNWICSKKGMDWIWSKRGMDWTCSKRDMDLGSPLWSESHGQS